MQTLTREKMLRLRRKVLDINKVEWILRVAIFGTFLGHGVLALQLKTSFLNYITAMTGISGSLAENLLITIGTMDIITAILAIVFPFKLLLIWAASWGFLTALARPMTGEPVWDFIERWANWGAPLALLYLRGLPKKINLKELFR